jgi:hypothetical protein
VLIALIEYLRSGANKVGFLNKSLEKNSLHKWEEEDVSGESSEEGEDTVADVVGEDEVSLGIKVGKGKNVAVDVVDEGSTLRRSSRAKRGLADGEQSRRDTKVPRRT